MNLFKDEMEKSLDDLKWGAKICFYLEQDSDPTFPNLEGGFDNPKTEQDPNVLISLRMWSKQLSRPISVRDIVVPKNFTVAELKQVVAKHAPVKPEQIILVEEETQKLFNLYVDNKTPLTKYGIMNGDVLHIEEIEADFHKSLSDIKSFTSRTKDFFTYRVGRFMFAVDESEQFYKKRTENEQTLNSIHQIQSQEKQKEKEKEKQIEKEGEKEKENESNQSTPNLTNKEKKRRKQRK